jgi:hypothetical protein
MDLVDCFNIAHRFVEHPERHRRRILDRRGHIYDLDIDYAMAGVSVLWKNYTVRFNVLYKMQS